MRLVISFDPNYGSREPAELGDAFWLVESTPNRTLAQVAWDTGSTHFNSAIFGPQSVPATAEEAVDRFDDADLHHPTWTEIAFTGVALSSEIEQRLADRDLIAIPTDDGFLVRRSVR
jgi:hypothetical protein